MWVSYGVAVYWKLRSTGRTSYIISWGFEGCTCSLHSHSGAVLEKHCFEMKGSIDTTTDSGDPGHSFSSNWLAYPRPSSFRVPSRARGLVGSWTARTADSYINCGAATACGMLSMDGIDGSLSYHTGYIRASVDISKSPGRLATSCFESRIGGIRRARQSIIYSFKILSSCE